MACGAIKLPNGQAAIVCGVRRVRPSRCACCGRRATLECDYPAPKKKSGTCDRPLCARCAVHVGEDRDYCPHHLDDVVKQGELSL